MSERIIGKKPMTAIVAEDRAAWLSALAMEERKYVTGPGWKTVQEIMADLGIARCTADNKIRDAIRDGRMEKGHRKTASGRISLVFRLTGKK